jgi:hypothetical protein
MMPAHALSNIEIEYFVREAGITDFRGIFMRDTLPARPRTNEKGVINLDSIEGDGTHWVCWKKHGNIVNYYDSFGNITPPIEFIEYVKNCQVFYNRDCEQEENTIICGHLCILNLCN